MIVTAVLASILAAPHGDATYPEDSGVMVSSGGATSVLYNIAMNRPDVDDISDFTNLLGVTPIWAWFGHTPLVAQGSLGGALTQTAGTATAIRAPFCPGGDWSDVDDCQNARRFDADAYTTSSAALTYTGDLTICGVWRPSGLVAGDAFLFSSTQGTGDGLELKVTAASSNVAVLTADGTTTTSTASVARADHWFFGCAVAIDSTSLATYIMNAAATGTGAFAAPWEPGAGSWVVGARDSAGTSPFVGDILWLAIWNTGLTTTQMSQIFQRQQGIPPVQGQITTTLTTASSTCCMVDDMIECFGTNMIPMGCEVPGVPTSTGGLLLIDSHSNRFLRSRTLNSGWTQVGTDVVAGPNTSVTPLSDNRGVYSITDDDNETAEYIEQVVSITFVNGPVKIGVWARSAEGTQALDLQIRETTGGACTESNVDFTAQDITEEWSLIEWTYNGRVDADCTSGTFRFAAVTSGGDIADVAETGVAYIMPQLLNSPIMPPIYSETAGSASTFGGARFRWNNNLALSPDDVHTWSYEVDFMPLTTQVSSAAGAVLMYNDDGNGAPTDYIGIALVQGTNDIRADYSANNASWTTYEPAAGTSVALKWVINYGLDVYTLYADGVSVATSATAATAPTGIDSLGFGSNQNAARLVTYGVTVSRAKAYRTK